MTEYRVLTLPPVEDETKFEAPSLDYAIKFCRHLTKFREARCYILQKRRLWFFFLEVKREWYSPRTGEWRKSWDGGQLVK